jgi:taurine dioxygenase
MFANQYLAFESLSDGLKDLMLGLRAVHRDHLVTESYNLVGRSDPIEACHPVVRAHPETGRRALFLNALFVERFEGWTTEESRGLLQHLYLASSAVELCYRHRWEDGDVVIFDNRGSLHYAVHDHGDATRVLYRATTAGDRPAGSERHDDSLSEGTTAC